MPNLLARLEALPRSSLMYCEMFMPPSLDLSKPSVKRFINFPVYSLLNMDKQRKIKLAQLIQTRFDGDRAKFQDAVGLTKGRVSQLLHPDEAFGERAAQSLVNKLNLADRWFEGKLLPEKTISGLEAGPRVRGLVPLISWVQAGSWCSAVDTFSPGDAETWLPCIAGHSEGAYALRVRGDSMTAPSGNSRTYPQGCVIFIDPGKKAPNNGDRVIAKLCGTDEVTFKIYKNEDGRQWLQPLNPSHEPIRDEFTVLGTVIGKWEDE